MILRVRLLGSGTDDDPFRVPLPIYQMLFSGQDLPVGSRTIVAIVRIPDGEYEPPKNGESETRATVRGIPNIIIALNAAQRLRWLRRMRAKYRERAVDYDVDAT